MPRISKDQAPLMVDEPEIQGRYAELDGYTVAFESFRTDFDPAALFRGLPDDRCQCPHWGIVTAGRIEVRYADSTETFSAGDVYYIRPGHLPHPFTGTEVVEFSPTEQLQATMAVVGANMGQEAVR
jgi:hypothetical protein